MNNWVKSVKDEKMQKVLKIAQSIGPRKATVLIYGESGVGKELLSRYIHDNSQRAQGEFVAVNCAAVPENLLESELFGYEKGAFTGAAKSKVGKLERADRGTFLLDEISEMPLLLQGKLLRVLQEGELERLGGTATKKIDVRFICTSNKNLSEMVQKGEFRRDLFYRLNVIPVEIPPLRERKKDLVSLVDFFRSKVVQENNLDEVKFSPSAMKKIVSWTWPGNIRELQNVIERSILLGPSDMISSENIQIENFVENKVEDSNPLIKAGMTIHEAERMLILKTLDSTMQNRTQAARILGISIRTLRNKLNEYKNTNQLNSNSDYPQISKGGL